MDSTGNINIVHESEAQRQFVRVKFPASIQFTADGTRRQYRLHDISAGGFSFDPGTDHYNAGDSFSGHVVLAVDAVGFTIPVTFDVKTTTEGGASRLGCVFQDLGPKEIAALRQVITAYLGGELVTAGDMLATLSRENFVRVRNNRGAGLSVGAKLRALIGTLVVFVLGLIAFGYTVTKLYDIVFVAHAAAAKVATSTYTITMPRDGTYFSLVQAGAQVKKGQPLGQFQTALLDVVEGVSGSFKLTPEQLGELVGQQLKGSLASPCDCIVQKMYATDSQYILRNQSIAALVPADAKPYVLARFHYDQMKHLPIGRKVYFHVNGSEQAMSGKITQLRVLPAQTIDANGLNDLNGLNTNAAITDVIAVIEPDQALGLAHLDEPVEVMLDPLFERFR